MRDDLEGRLFRWSQRDVPSGTTDNRAGIGIWQTLAAAAITSAERDQIEDVLEDRGKNGKYAESGKNRRNEQNSVYCGVHETSRMTRRGMRLRKEYYRQVLIKSTAGGTEIPKGYCSGRLPGLDLFGILVDDATDNLDAVAAALVPVAALVGVIGCQKPFPGVASEALDH